MKSSQFKPLFRSGRRITKRSAIFFLKKNQDKISRLGLSVSKKVGNSPQRNRVKRVSRELFKFFPYEEKDLIILFSKSGSLDLNSFRKDYLEIWRKNR